ncbi:MAG: glycosyltransferase family 2 protein [Planctomycetales bacterium]|nr:glycosyltransferase family 2 protein [Planctomycetales bacterium]
MTKWIAALPVFNEEQYVDEVLTEVTKYADEVLVVNDGSSDGTAERLKAWPGVHVEHHSENRGYGAALKTAFRFALEHDYEYLITLDCDGQHQPQRLPRFLAACQQADIVSGSRYLKQYAGDSQPPSQRLFINRRITGQLNDLLGLTLTDAFCGFKAYRVEALKLLDIEDDGYAMPLELWVQAAMRGLRVIEIPVPLIYLDLNRSFGGALDEAEQRLKYYNTCIERSVAAMKARGFELPQKPAARRGLPQ